FLRTGRVLALRGHDERLTRSGADRLVRHGGTAADRRLRGAGHLEAVLGGLLHLVLDPGPGRIEDGLLLQAPLRLCLGELGAGTTRDEVAILDAGLQGLEDLLERLLRPAVLLQAAERLADLVAALLDRG